MKHLLLHILPAALGLMLPLSVQAAIMADSQITQVTVYPDSARITRTASIDLPAGDHQVFLPQLPQQLDTASLRVAGESSAPVMLGSINLTEQQSSDVVQTRERQLREEIRQWQGKRQEAVDAKIRAEQQLAFIRATGLGNNTAAKEAVTTAILPLEQWQQAWKTLDIATAEAQAKIRAADKVLYEFDQGIAQLQRQLEGIATGINSSRAATLQVSTPEATRLKLTIRYQISGASWSPVYEAELNTEQQTIQLKTQAEIQQLTGEDWSNVQVNLSTLRPTNNNNLPELQPWTIGFYEPPIAERYHSGAAEMADVAAEPMMMARPAPAPMARPMIAQTSTLLAGAYNAEFQVPGKLSLKSGSEQRRVTLQSQAIETELSLSSYPRLDPISILTADSTYKGSSPLLPGTVSLYRDGSFIGLQQLASLQSGEAFKLSFGEDDRVKVTFQPAPEKTTEPGLLSSRKRQDFSYIVKVSNQHDASRSITIYDSIPVATHADIAVSLSGDHPSIKDVDQKAGVMAWIRDISPNTQVELQYGYSISYPQDKQLSGL